MEKILYSANVRTVFTLDDGIEEIEVEEPIGWDAMEIVIDFTLETNTYKNEFTDPEIKLSWEMSKSSGQKIKAVKALGVDAVLIFRFAQVDKNSVITGYYEAQANLTSYDEIFDLDKGYLVSVNFEIRSLSADLRDQFTVKTKINKTVSLRGLSLSPIEVRNLLLHKKDIYDTAVFDFNKLATDSTSSPPEFILGENPPYDPGAMFDDNDAPTNQYFKAATLPIKIVTSSVDDLQTPTAPEGQLIYSGATLPPGVSQKTLTFNWDFQVYFSIGDLELMPGHGNTFFGFKIYKKSGIVTPGNDYSLTHDIAAYIGEDYAAPALPSGSPGRHQYYKRFIGSGSLTLTGDDAIFIKVYIRKNVAFSLISPPVIKMVDIPNLVFTVSETRNFAATLTKGYDIRDAVAKQLEIILDKRDVFRSDFLTRGSGCGGNHLIMSGRMIRGDDGATVELSAQDIYNNLSARYCMGMNVEKDVNDNDVVRLEPLEYFFRNIELINLGLNYSAYRRYTDASIIYNQGTFGFNKFPQDQQNNSLDEWMSKMTYLFPPRKAGGPFQKIIDWLLSSYYIEYTRRQLLRFDHTKAYETDKDVFMIHDTNVLLSTYSTSDNRFLATSGTAPNQLFITDSENTGICIGDVITISGSASNNGQRTVTAVRELDGTTLLTFIETVIDEMGNNITITFSPRLSAVKDENFALVGGMLSPSTAYNMIHHIRRIVLSWAKWFRSGFTYADNSQPISYQTGGNNNAVVTVLKDTVGCRLGDNQATFVRDGAGELGDASMSMFDSALFTSDKFEITTSLDWDTVSNIRKAYENKHPDGKDYGYWTWINPKGIVEKGYLVTLKYQPVSKICKLILRERNG